VNVIIINQRTLQYYCGYGRNLTTYYMIIIYCYYVGRGRRSIVAPITYIGTYRTVVTRQMTIIKLLYYYKINDDDGRGKNSLTVRLCVCIAGEPSKTGTATIRIYTKNKNDEEPKFSQQVYTPNVDENAGPNTLVTTVVASDKDGDNVRYAITITTCICYYVQHIPVVLNVFFYLFAYHHWPSLTKWNFFFFFAHQNCKRYFSCLEYYLFRNYKILIF